MNIKHVQILDWLCNKSSGFKITGDPNHWVPISFVAEELNRHLRKTNTPKISVYEVGKALSYPNTLRVGRMKYSRPQLSSVVGLFFPSACVNRFVNERRLAYLRKQIKQEEDYG